LISAAAAVWPPPRKPEELRHLNTPTPWAAVGVVAACLAQAAQMACAGDLVGQSAQALIVATLDGKTADLASLRGKVVLVNYWARRSARSTAPTTSAASR